MPRPTFSQIALLAALLPTTATALSIRIDYSYDTDGFFQSRPQAQLALAAACDFFEELLVDTLDPIAPGEGERWRQTFAHPGSGETYRISSSTRELDPGANEYNPALAVSADTLLLYAGGRDLGNSLGTGGAGGFNSFGSTDWNRRVRTRGQTGVDASPPVDFARWGGSLAFNSRVPWSYELDLFPHPGEFDFLSVALHEIGHVLGLSSNNVLSSWNTYQVGASFTGPESVREYGGAVPTVSESNRHWAEGTMSLIYGTAFLQEAALDPSLGEGTRKLLTELDVAALRDVGWMVVPEPGAAALGALTLAFWMGWRRR